MKLKFVNKQGFVSFLTLITCLIVCFTLLGLIKLKQVNYFELLHYRHTKDLITEIKNATKENKYTCDLYINSDRYTTFNSYEYLTTEKYETLSAMIEKEEQDLCVSKIETLNTIIYIIDFKDSYIYIKK